MIVAGLAALPLFLPAETIRTELVARLEAATGREIRIDGPVSLRVIPTARLSAEGIGIGGLTSGTEDFSVESVSFGLSLLPLLAGNIEIYGVTITRPVVLVETDETGGTNWTATDADAAPAPTSIEDMIAGEGGGADAGSATEDTLTMLDRLSIGRVRIAEGTLIWRDASSGSEERIERIDIAIRVPRLDGAGTIEGSFTRLGVAHSLKLEIGERPDPARFESIPINLTLSSDAGTVIAEGTAMAGETLYDGSVETEGDSLLAFAEAHGIELPAMPVFGAFNVASRLNASATQVRIEEFGVDLGGLQARGAAAIRLDRARPGIGLRVAAGTIDTALFVTDTGTASQASGEATAPSPGGADEIDFSALRLVDANVDFSADQILVGRVPVTGVGVDMQIVNGGLKANLRSATVDGAPASGAVAIDASAGVPTIEGSIEVEGLDAAGVLALAGMDLPIDAGTIGADVSFATRGTTQAGLIENLDGSGRVSLADGNITGLGIAEYVGGDPAANEIDDVDLSAEFSSLSTPIDAEGGFDWRGERFAVAGRGDPRALVAGGNTPVSVNASSQRVELGFSGEAGLAGLGSGTVSLSTPSLRNLLAWIGQPIAPGGGLGGFSIKGAAALSENAFSFDKANFTLDGSSGIGTGKVTFGGKPKVVAGLSMKRLDLTPYLVASGSAAAGAGGGGATRSGGGDGGWSTDRIGFDGLRAIDANLNLKAEEIVADQIKIGPSQLTAAISGGKLTAELTEMSLYSGIGVGTLSVDGSSDTPALEAFFRLDAVDALPFLTDALGFSWLEGTASFSFDVRAAGGSEAALMAGLNGEGTMDFRDGAIRGVDIPKMVRTLSIDTLLGWQQSSAEKTDFSEISGTYAIENGILTNRDLVLIGPLMRITGAGTVDIPARALSYRVDPKIVASLEGQGGSEDLEGFAVPVRVEGPWSRPRIYPEIEGILQNPQAALDQLRKLGGGLFGGTGRSEPQTKNSTGQSVEDRINEEISKGLGRLFGGNGDRGTSAPEAPPPAAEAPPEQEAAAPADQPLAEPPEAGTRPGPALAAEPVPSQEPGAPPADQPLAEQPANDASPEAPSAETPQAPVPPDAAEAGEQQPAPDQPIDLLRSIIGQ